MAPGSLDLTIQREYEIVVVVWQSESDPDSVERAECEGILECLVI